MQSKFQDHMFLQICGFRKKWCEIFYRPDYYVSIFHWL